MKQFMPFLLAVLCAFPATGQSAPQQSVVIADMDRKTDPCTDFFGYSNGAWRANNPIPPSMGRWSRRWQAGELAKTQLKDVLDDVSSKHDWQKGSVEQLIGDYYGACIDESAINKRDSTQSGRG